MAREEKGVNARKHWNNQLCRSGVSLTDREIIPRCNTPKRFSDDALLNAIEALIRKTAKTGSILKSFSQAQKSFSGERS